MNILHVDTNHPLLIEQLAALGHTNHEDFTSSKTQIEAKISNYDGLIIRSRFTIDKPFLDNATNLKFIGRVGAGLETIDVDYAKKKGIHIIAAPEGNRKRAHKADSRTKQGHRRQYRCAWQAGARAGARPARPGRRAACPECNARPVAKTLAVCCTRYA